MSRPALSLEQLHPQACAIAKDAACLVGLSGGRDSVALLLILKEIGCRQLTACHINHGIRGKEADADEQFCKDLCARLGIPCICHRVDVPALAQETGESLETAARNIRRKLLTETAAAVKAEAIVMAHHADDQAETVLFRMGRGAAGPRGMKPIDKGLGCTWLLRPLLHVRREEITAWLCACGETWRDDSTNAVADVARNSIRHEVLPALNKALGRDVVPVLCRSARLQQETLEALEAAMAALPMLDPQGRLYLPFVLAQPLPLQKAIVRRYLQNQGVPQIDEAMIIAVCHMLPADATSARICLPGGYMAIRRQKRLIIQASSPN